MFGRAGNGGGAALLLGTGGGPIRRMGKGGGPLEVLSVGNAPIEVLASTSKSYILFELKICLDKGGGGGGGSRGSGMVYN